jgi:hypothetical protein
VFRAALFSIVFALVAGPEATLLCKVWCPSEASASDCRHHGQASSVRVKTADHCDAADPSVVAVTQEDGRPVAPDSGARHAVPRQRFELVRPHQGTQTVELWARENVLETRPLEKTLRL